MGTFDGPGAETDMNGLANDVRQRMLQTGSYNVPQRDIELHWRKMLHSYDTKVEDFAAWAKRCGWRATLRDGVVEVRR